MATIFAVMTASCTEKSDSLFNEPEVIETRYTSEQMEYLREFYEFCLTFYIEQIPAYMITEEPTTEDMISVVRYCDLLDRSGDIFPEIDGYYEIKNILWPNGYGNL